MTDGWIDDLEDPVDLSNGDNDADNSTSTADPSARGLRTSSTRSSSISGGSVLTERLTRFLVEGGDVDLLLSRNDREDNLLRWLRALDVHLMGACRADERLKPLLKLNVSTGVAEDRLLSHLSQHFEPSEVGMLARCLCIPLVSIRVGKINKQGAFLCPTATRESGRILF